MALKRDNPAYDPDTAQAPPPPITAAGGAQRAKTELQRLAEEQWKRQMEGLGQSLGQYGGADAYHRGIYERGPGAGENFYQSYGGQFLKPTATSGVAQNYEAYTKNPTASGIEYQVGRNQLIGQSEAEKQLAQSQAQLGGPGRSEGLQYGGAANVGNFAARQQQGLEREGIYEQMVRQGIQGNDPLMARMRAEGTARINQEMARKGGFKSGASNTATGNYLGALDAADYQNKMNRAQAAQGMQLGRLGQAQGLAESQTQEDLGIAGMRGQYAGQADQSRLARLMGLQSSAEGTDAGRLARIGTSFDMGQGADAAEQARWGLKGQLAGQQDPQDLARLLGMGATANSAQGQETGRLNDQWNSYMGLAGARAGLTAGAYNNATQQYGQYQGDSINAGANAAQLREQAANNDWNRYMSMIGTWGKIAGSPAGF